ncbi:MAG: hypothetical protein ACTSRP_14955 [Candidatus Helarchaeota archaeon]
MTESRKVQEIRGSYYLYLPKKWCVENRITKNQEISIEVLEDNTLLLMNKSNVTPLIGKISIDLDEWGDENTDIYFLIFSSYICGADKIIIQSKKKINLHLRQEIDQMVRDLIDLEVLEEDDHHIVIRTLGQTPEDIKNIFQRMLNNVLYMLEQLSQIKDLIQNEKLADNYENIKESIDIIISRYSNVKRFGSFIERGIHLLLRDRNMLRKLEWSVDDCIFNLLVIQYIQSIGGHCSRIAELLLKSSKIPKIFGLLAEDSYNIYKDSIIVYQYGNMIDAYKIFNNHSEFDVDFQQEETITNGDHLLMYHYYARKIAEIAVHKFISKTVVSSRNELLSKPKIE